MNAIENKILSLENQYWKAMKAGDIDAAVSLTRFPCFVAGPEGVMRVTETEYREMMQAHDAREFDSVKIKNPKIDLLGDDTALIIYSTQVNDMNMIDVSTWVKEKDQWKCAFHSENPEQKNMPQH